jgi:hypothetical protein
MKKMYIKPSAVCIQVDDRLTGGVLNIPMSGYTTPEESDAKSFDDWEEKKIDDSYINFYNWY